MFDLRDKGRLRTSLSNEDQERDSCVPGPSLTVAVSISQESVGVDILDGASTVVALVIRLKVRLAKQCKDERMRVV